ncbi:MAG TPA: nitrogenase iron-molybdenum cofactor biosynthesis protein NifN [Polyangiales bacterium]
MAKVVKSQRAYAVNPLKSSAPLGAALAFLGIERSVPLFHGSQGCTSLALVLAVRHFKEAIPIQTTALDEVATILGGFDNLEEALVNVVQRRQPAFIGIASTALVETRGEDIAGDLALIRTRQAAALQGTAIVFASTPDFEGAIEDGWAAATSAVIQALVPTGVVRNPQSRKLNVLPSVHQSAADLEELRDLIESFGLCPVFLPDISTSLDGHVPDEYQGTSLGGTSLAAIGQMADARHILAIGEHMRTPALTLAERIAVSFTLLPSVTGLAGSDALVGLLSTLSGVTAPERVRRQRSQLLDAMLDGHFWFSGRRIAIGSDPDLLYPLAKLVHSLGAEVVSAVASTGNSAVLQEVPCATVMVSDLGELEESAARLQADLLVTHSHGRQAAARLGIPLFRVGFPIFDRLGAQARCSVGYRGTRQLIYELANALMAEMPEHGQEKSSTSASAPIVESWA